MRRPPSIDSFLKRFVVRHPQGLLCSVISGSVSISTIEENTTVKFDSDCNSDPDTDSDSDVHYSQQFRVNSRFAGQV